MFALIVTEPFADYAKGAVIRAADAMDAALKDNPHRVVRVPVAALPAEASEPAASAELAAPASAPTDPDA